MGNQKALLPPIPLLKDFSEENVSFPYFSKGSQLKMSTLKSSQTFGISVFIPGGPILIRMYCYH